MGATITNGICAPIQGKLNKARKMQTLTQSPTHMPSYSPGHAPLDVLVLHARELVGEQKRLELFQRLHRLASTFKRPGQRGPWLLVLTHSAMERSLASILTQALTTRTLPFQGVKAVNEGNCQQSALAALDLHRLHFPHLSEQQRGMHILVLGGKRERQILSGKMRGISKLSEQLS